jgi:Uma2 family endonuclease
MELVPGNDDVRMSDPGVKLTYDDFVLFSDDGKRHELIDGEHFVTPSPNRKHQKVSGNLFLLIGTWLEQHPIGQIYFAQDPAYTVIERLSHSRHVSVPRSPSGQVL